MRREYRTGQLSAEERAARLAEMAAAAEAHEEQRGARLREVAEREAAEGEQGLLKSACLAGWPGLLGRRACASLVQCLLH